MDVSVPRVPRDLPDLPVILAHPAILAPPVLRDLWVFVDLLVLVVHAVRRASQVPRVPPVLLVP